MALLLHHDECALFRILSFMSDPIAFEANDYNSFITAAQNQKPQIWKSICSRDKMAPLYFGSHRTAGLALREGRNNVYLKKEVICNNNRSLIYRNCENSPRQTMEIPRWRNISKSSQEQFSIRFSYILYAGYCIFLVSFFMNFWLHTVSYSSQA